MQDQDQPSFSRGSRWKIGLDLAARTVLVGAVLVMVNYLGAQFFQRFYLSSQTRIQLSSRTASVLHSLTNRVGGDAVLRPAGRCLPRRRRVAERIQNGKSEDFRPDGGLHAGCGQGGKNKEAIQPVFRGRRIKTSSFSTPVATVSKSQLVPR